MFTLISSACSCLSYPDDHQRSGTISDLYLCAHPITMGGNGLAVACRRDAQRERETPNAVSPDNRDFTCVADGLRRRIGAHPRDENLAPSRSAAQCRAGKIAK